jgi:hypothetical protein
MNRCLKGFDWDAYDGLFSMLYLIFGSGYCCLQYGNRGCLGVFSNYFLLIDDIFFGKRRERVRKRGGDRNQ